MSSKKTTPPRPRSKSRATKPLSIRDLKHRKLKAEHIITIPVEVDGEAYVLYSRHLSLGAARSFTQLSQMDTDDPTRGPESINVAANFLQSHIRDEDGSELPTEEIESIIDSLDLEFAGELAKHMIEFIMGIGSNDEDSTTSGSEDTPPGKKRIKVGSRCKPLKDDPFLYNVYEFAHSRKLTNVEDPGGLLDEIESGGISAFTFYRWAEFYRLRAERLKHPSGYANVEPRSLRSPRSPRSMMDSLKQKFSGL